MRKIRDARRSFGGVVVEKECFAFRRRSENAGVRRKNLTAKTVKLHVADDIRPQRAERMRQRGSTKAGIEFFGDGAAADHFAAFENERLESALGHIESGDQGVVTAANENHTLSERHISSPPSNEMRPSSSLSK